MDFCRRDDSAKPPTRKMYGRSLILGLCSSISTWSLIWNTTCRVFTSSLLAVLPLACSPARSLTHSLTHSLQCIVLRDNVRYYSTLFHCFLVTKKKKKSLETHAVNYVWKTHGLLRVSVSIFRSHSIHRSTWINNKTGYTFKSIRIQAVLLAAVTWGENFLGGTVVSKNSSVRRKKKKTINRQGW